MINRSAYYIFSNELKTLNRSIIDLSKGEVPVLNNQHEIIEFYPNTSSPALSKNLKSKVVAIAPTRISFAGGGSDLNYWFERNRGCVVNLAIGKYARVSIIRKFTQTIRTYRH